MQYTWFGNATVRISGEEGAILFDPFVTRNPKLPEFDPQSSLGIDAVLVTHGHFDHVTGIPDVLRNREVPVYAPPSVCDTLKDVLKVDSDLLKSVDTRTNLEFGDLEVETYSAEHIEFTPRYVLGKLTELFRPGRIGRHGSTLFRSLIDHSRMPMGRCYAWNLRTDSKSLLHFGSLALDEEESYPEAVDAISLPFQGSNRLDQIGMEFVEKFEPSEVVLHHFDDAFPPISSPVSTEEFERIASRSKTEPCVYRPDYFEPISFEEE